MENAKDGFNLQVSILSTMLGITTPHLRQQAEKLLRDALAMNPTSPVSDSSFLGRMRKLLFKPLPRKIKKSNLSCMSIDPTTSDESSVTPPIAREDPVTEPKPLDLPDPTPARHSWDIDLYGLIQRQCRFNGFALEEDPTIATPDYFEDPIVYMPEGHYNSKGQRLDEDGDVVRDERVYICEDAIYSYSRGTPFITDTYDLYALVKDFPLGETRAAADKILQYGAFTPKDLHLEDTRPTPVPPGRNEDKPGSKSQVDPAELRLMQIKDENTHHPSTTAPISQTRNLVAHYIRTIALPPLPNVDQFTKRQRKKLLKDRGKQEKARLRQLRTFVAALKA